MTKYSAALLRSVFFQIVFFVWNFIASVTGYILAFLPERKPLVEWAATWAKGVALLERTVLGIDYKMMGQENFPPRPFIAALQHQSAWETPKLLYWFKDDAVVMKQELLNIPIWGFCARKQGAIGVARSRKIEDLRHFIASAKQRVAQKRSVIMFPQGTRSSPEKPAPVQKGIGVLYEALGVPVVPVTLNSGKFWPKNSFIKYPGRITVTAHPPIQPGLPREELLEKLQDLYDRGRAR